MSQTQTSSQPRIRQAAKRGHYDRETIYAIIDDALVATVAVVEDGKPIAIPMVVGRIGDAIYLHGSRSSRLMKLLMAGAEVCVTMTHVDGVVVARSGMHCSMNYRSAVVHGVAEPVEEGRKPELLHQVVARVIPGSAGDYRDHLPKEIKATSLVSVSLERASAKIRTGGPIDDDEDLQLPHWAGVIPVNRVFGEPQRSDDLPESIETPDYARNHRR